MIGKLKLVVPIMQNYIEEKNASKVINDKDIKKSWKETNSKNKIQLKVNSKIDTLIYVMKEFYKINLQYNSNFHSFTIHYKINQELSQDTKLEIRNYLSTFSTEYPINQNKDILINIIQLIKENDTVIESISDNDFIEIINYHTLSLKIMYDIYVKYLELEEEITYIINDID